ncbi:MULTISPECIES: PH domain-containing protein [unclassified Amycolatopsis]|uniref:PH domain-containing protein n=1 Tax=unclassified Amycolatopsis TaxID=2618356 RepID=UPI002E0D6A5E|nr:MULTISPECIES: PH domain-containing protein [unclassified Amycolatopsis]WSJ73377.1 PH domain-containing protein [Amycolatopsis sp. NBC_01307]WSK82969.1 PH domain-containing protein [Amycolatopsis sp. NBC_01286]
MDHSTTDSSRPVLPVRPEPLAVRPPRHRLARRFILWRTLNTLFWAIGVLGVFVTLHIIFAGIRTWLDPITWGVGAIFAANFLFMPTYRYLVHRWETTDEAVYSLSGWITREWRIVPVSRIQSIDTVQGPIEQLLGLSTIKVTTASHEGHVKIEGLETPIAEEAVRRLNEIAQATPGDAT